ncbi:hypothetical protein GOODEAATRI_010403 [Goodea atripinnis]|uniref:Uncharacterized protein n=1 Tax=Goodea atripinnis TaxID=208336 RepID=A0ABV0P3B7_9TELE
MRSECRRSPPPQEGTPHWPRRHGLRTFVLSSRQVLVRGQMECASPQSLTKGRDGQNASLIRYILPNIDETEPVSRVHNCQEDN